MFNLPTLKNPSYGNIKVLNLDNKHIFNCSPKKCKWYLDRNLANIIQENPIVIQLNFITNGDGRADDKYFLQELKNMCVVCGTTEKLSRHHVVPICYRRHFPEIIKDRNHYDILLVCKECHHKYETHASILKKIIAQEYDVKHAAPVVDRKLGKVVSAAHALQKHYENIPEARREELLSILYDFYGHKNLKPEEIENATKIPYQSGGHTKTESKLVVEKLDNINEFVRRWREHFITYTKPQYLPQHWRIDKDE